MKRLLQFVYPALLLLGGCTAPVSQIPPELIYSRSSADIANAAFIRGTDRKDKVPIFDHHTGCVMSIDGKSVRNERERWKEALPVEPGERTVAVLYYHGVFIAKTEFTFVFEPNTHYEVRFQENGRKSVDFWIVNLKNETPVTGIERSSMMGGTGGGFIPIIIPAG